VKLIGVKQEDIIKETELLLENKKEYETMSRAVNPYGDGKASERIVQALLHYFGFTDKKPKEFKGA